MGQVKFYLTLQKKGGGRKCFSHAEGDTTSFEVVLRVGKRSSAMIYLIGCSGGTKFMIS